MRVETNGTLASPSSLTRSSGLVQSAGGILQFRRQDTPFEMVDVTGLCLISAIAWLFLATKCITESAASNSVLLFEPLIVRWIAASR
jgi:hypothetical protein